MYKKSHCKKTRLFVSCLCFVSLAAHSALAGGEADSALKETGLSRPMMNEVHQYLSDDYIDPISTIHSIEELLTENIDPGAVVFFDLDETLVRARNFVDRSPGGNTELRRLFRGLGKAKAEGIRNPFTKGTYLAKEDAIRSLTDHDLIEEIAPKVIAHLQSKGVRVFGLTSGAGDSAGEVHNNDARTRRMKELGIDFTRGLDTLDVDSKIKNGRYVFSTFEVRGGLEKPALHEGILYCNGYGAAKGIVARKFLDTFYSQPHLKPSQIVMIDDNSDFLGFVLEEAEALGIPFYGYEYDRSKDLDQAELEDPLTKDIVNLQIEHFLKGNFISNATAKEMLQQPKNPFEGMPNIYNNWTWPDQD